MCDPADVCSGTTAICFNTFLSNTTICRASTDLCDAPEYCTGRSGQCPNDVVFPKTTICRASISVCDAPERCTGSLKSCPSDLLFPNGTVCRPSVGSCDIAEVCSGTSAQCPSDQVLPNGTLCRASAGICDAAETCTGLTGTCPNDVKMPKTTICRTSTDLCDAPEYCTGNSSSCPTNILFTNGTVCRSPAGLCDVAELCSGTSAACPVDAVARNGTICRPPSQMCDPAESCNGHSASCPADVNPLCPWAWIEAPDVPQISQQEYCASLSDGTKILINITGSFVDMFVVTGLLNGQVATIRSSMFIDTSLAEPVLSLGAPPITSNWTLAQNASSSSGVKILNFSDSSLVIDFEWILTPLIAAPQTVKLGSCARQETIFPAGTYCGRVYTSAEYRTALLVLYPQSNQSVHQEAMLYMAYNGAGGAPVRTAISLTFLWIVGIDVIFTSKNSSGDLIGNVQRIYVDPIDGFRIYFNSGVPYVGFRTTQFLSLCSPNFDYTCQEVSSPSSVVYQLCIQPNQDFTAVQIDLSGTFAGTLCDSVTAALTYPLRTVADPLPACLLAAGIRSIQYDFWVQKFATTVTGNYTPQFTRSYCSAKSSTFCGVFDKYTFMVGYGRNMVQGASFNAASNESHQYASMGVLFGIGCSQLKASYPSSNLGASGFSVIGGNFNVLVGSTSTPMTTGKCYSPLNFVVRFGGSAVFSGTTYYATMLVGGLDTVTPDRYYDITYRLSNSTNMLCSMYAQGMIVFGGNIIFANQAVGSCVDTAPNSVIFIGTTSSTGAVTMSVTRPAITSYSSQISIPVSVSTTVDPGTSPTETDQVPAGRYCTDIMYRHFVMIQVNRNGTTTIYASINGTQSTITLWVDVFNGGSTVVNRTANGTSSGGSFPVRLLKFTFAFATDSHPDLQYYVFTLDGGATTSQATAASCSLINDAAQKFCGVKYPADARVNSSSYASNTSFAVLSVVADFSSSSLSTSLVASRRVSQSQPLSITFKDHPRLLPFFFPQVTDISYDASTSWSLSFSDNIGTISLTMTTDKCGSAASQLASDVYGGLASPLTMYQTGNLQVVATVKSRNATDGSASLALALLNASSSTRLSFMTIPSAYMIDSKLLYWAGQSLPMVMIEMVAGSNVSLAGPLFSGIISSNTIPQVPPMPYMDQRYCGASTGGSPWTLIANTTLTTAGEYSFIVADGSGSGFSRLAVYWLPPMNLAGGFAISRTVGSYSATSLKYNASSDTFLLTTSQSPANALTMTRGKCSPAIPDGTYCAYDDGSNTLNFQMNVRNMTITTTLPYTHDRLQCVGVMASSSRGLFDCLVAPLPRSVHDPMDYSESSYSQDGGRAVLGITTGYSGNMIVKTSFSISAKATFVASQDACLTQPQLLRSYSSVKTMQSLQFSNNTRVAVNSTGMIFVADVDRSCIFTVDPKSGFVTVFAGQCDVSGYQDGAGATAQFNRTTGVAFDKSDILYVLDAGNSRIRTVTPGGLVSSFSGNGNNKSIDGSGAAVSYQDLAGIALHPVSGRLYISEAYRIRILNQATNNAKTFVGSTTFGNADGTGVKAMLNRPGKAAFTANALTAYFVDSGNNCLRKISTTGAVVTIAESVPGGFLDTGISPSGPSPSHFDPVTENIFMIDRTGVWIFVVSSGVVTTYNSSSRTSSLETPNASDFALTPSGSLIVADGSSLHALYD